MSATSPRTPQSPPVGQWRLLVPDPGPGFLSANDRGHWAAKARDTRTWREACAWRAAADLRRGTLVPLQRAHVLATFRHRLARRRDAANLYPTVKAAIDGLVDAGVLPDDDDAHLLGPDMRTGDPVPRTHPRALVLTLTAVHDADTAAAAALGQDGPR